MDIFNKVNTNNKIYYYYKNEDSPEVNDYNEYICILCCKEKKSFLRGSSLKKE